MRRVRTVVVLVALGISAGLCHAQKFHYPSKPVRMIVPYPPVGGTDIIGRIIAQKAGEALGQPVVVDNRPGAGSMLGAELAVRAAADGYTVIMVSGSYATNAALHKLPYDPVGDIQPIVMIGDSGFVVVVPPAAPFRTISNLIGHAKANSRALNYGSAGAGSVTHMATELYLLMSGTTMTHIPYKGTGPALTALLGNEIQVLFCPLPAALPHVKAGRLRGIGVSTSKPLRALPAVPPINATVKGYEAGFWYGVWGPKGLDARIVARWNTEVAKIVKGRETQERLAAEGLEPRAGPPEEFRDAIARDIRTWRKVVTEAKITADQ